jgi:8-oxo-dGTP diphosphatase
MNKTQEINSYLVIRRRGLLLLLKRHNGVWEFPGGGVEFGEHPEKAALREAREETGLRTAGTTLLGLTSATFPSRGRKKHAVYAVYLAKRASGRVRISGEHADFGWFSKAHAARLRLGLNAKPVLKMI